MKLFKFRHCLVLSSLILIAFGCVHKSSTERQPSSSVFQGLSDNEILNAASSKENISVSDAWVVTENNASFISKIQAIRSAQAGSTIRMSYFIYSDDASSSYFTNELINAANRGVKIKLIVDFITNYSRFNLFKMMEQKGNGNIEVKMYGVPTAGMLKTAKYLTMACPDEKVESMNDCKNYKEDLIRKNRPVDDFYARLFLAGLSAKDPNAMKLAIFLGSQINLEKFKQQKSMSEKDKKDLMTFFKWVYEATVKNDIMAMLKVHVALSTEGEMLNPIMNELTGRIPKDMFNEDWEHLSDYTHHKILLVDDNFIQLGGRNIENSYHMEKNELSSKYTFMDTEFVALMKENGSMVSSAYDKVWNFKPMTKRLDEIDQFFGFNNQNPNLSLQSQETKQRMWACLETKPNTGLNDQVAIKDDLRTRMYNCLNDTTKVEPSVALLDKEFLNLKNEMSDYLVKYLNKSENADLKKLLSSNMSSYNWLNSPQFGFQLTAQDRSKMLMAYIENLHFNQKNPQKRIMGALNSGWNYESDLQYGKGIHELWLRGLENTCKVSSKDGIQRRVILHSAYFLPTAKMMTAFGKMVNGTWDCHNVRMTFLTNSIDTSDLSIINIYAKYQMLAFFEIYNAIRSSNGPNFNQNAKNKMATVDYYEYEPIRGSDGKIDKERKISLHTKVSVLGDDMIIGSANADVRSYYMDTNNGVYLRGVTDLVRDYTGMVDKTLADSAKAKNISEMMLRKDKPLDINTLRYIDGMYVKGMAAKFHVNLSDSNFGRIMEIQKDISDRVYNNTKIIFQPNVYLTLPPSNGEASIDQEGAKIRQLENLQYSFNRGLQIF